MPLLGRHKSSNSSSSSQSNSQNVNSTSSSPVSISGSGQAPARGRGHNQTTGSLSHTRQVCDSPLFGVRKQISFSGQQDSFKVTGSGNDFITSNQQSINTNLHGKSNNNHNRNNQIQNTAQSSQLNSIPQQITSQQIHYAFSIMDTNQDGMIDLRDLSQMLSNLGVPIDEAILFHIMSSVSKRGDHRVSEAEFLDWISKFIQVSDQGSTDQQQSDRNRDRDRHQPGNLKSEQARSSVYSSRTNKQLKQRTTGASALRFQPTGFSSSQLVAQPTAPAEVSRSRRGSGSGLALMRSLSSSAANSTYTSNTGSATPSVAATSAAGSAPAINSPSPTSSSSRQDRSDYNTNKQQQQQQRQQRQQQQQDLDLDAIHDLKAAFCVFDLDADGYITIDEVQAGLKLLGESWSPNELRQLLSKCSSNSSSPTSSKGQDLNKLSKRQQEQQLSKQRISIDDFVRLLL